MAQAPRVQAPMAQAPMAQAPYGAGDTFNFPPGASFWLTFWPFVVGYGVMEKEAAPASGKVHLSSLCGIPGSMVNE